MPLGTPGDGLDQPSQPDLSAATDPACSSIAETRQFDPSAVRTSEISVEADERDDLDASAEQEAPREKAPATEAGSKTPDEPRDLCNAVELKLTFELGETTIRLGDLRSLQAGYTFELNARTSSAIDIKAYGQVIGHGELVEVGDRIGVRFMEIANDGR